MGSVILCYTVWMEATTSGEGGGKVFTVYMAHFLARKFHDGQVDLAGNPYFSAHLEPVARLLRPYGPYAVMAGYLHDVIEDTDQTPESLRAEGVPEEVIDAVVAVSRIPGEPYKELIRRAAAHPLGALVKLADNTHNLAMNAELEKIDPKKAKSMREKRYLPARAVLLAAIAEREGVSSDSG